ncbi:uncharacterized protein DSM5745_10168 [Aspergillus mulundensis]|uniref:Uncharacterized protein n=1 Tax=Aspergillus mulundensis TaxID=1810919 RepID=A0A3D8QMQ2_9EURO|nr:hypothetical protein DSM5745_10168 [Aspergillus mulundensis]RDW63057.1 hypothetical protein DSM5745_10168 [Aspergillus mulundensis]
MDKARADFEDARVDIIYEATEYLTDSNLAPQFIEIMQTCLTEALNKTSPLPGQTVLYTARTTSRTPLTASQTTELSLLGWLCALFHAAYPTRDSITTTSDPRMQRGVGMANDTGVLRPLIYALLKKTFRTHPRYTNILELFLQAEMNVSMGQVSDTYSATQDIAAVGTDPRSWEVYEFMVEHSGTYPSWYMPIVLALEYLETATSQNKAQVRDVLGPIGLYVQIRNEVYDVVRDEGDSRACNNGAGNGIAANKCGWLIMHALDRADVRQKGVLLENYGRKERGAVETVIGVYKELDLERVFSDYEEKAHRLIQSGIDGIDEGLGLRKQVFRGLFEVLKMEGEYKGSRNVTETEESV